jgi:hypothetical protein
MGVLGIRGRRVRVRDREQDTRITKTKVTKVMRGEVPCVPFWVFRIQAVHVQTEHGS